MTRPELPESLPFNVLRQTWQPVAIASELPAGTVRHAMLLDVDLVLARFDDGTLLAARNACPHKGMRLARGRIVSNELQCAYHGWRYDRAGSCTTIPSLLCPTPEKQKLACLATFGVRERYGIIWVKLDPDERAALPDVPEFTSQGWNLIAAQPMVFEAGFRREIENFLDMTHFAFAHSTTLGVAASAVVPD